MAQALDPNDPQNMGQNIMQGIPGYGILQMLQKAGRGIPEGWQQAKELLGMSPRPPAPPPGQMPVARDAMGRPLPIDPRTGQPIQQDGGGF